MRESALNKRRAGVMTAEESLSTTEHAAIEARWHDEIRPLVASRAIDAAIGLARAWLAAETRRAARVYLLSELSSLLVIAERHEEDLAAIRERIALAPDDPISWLSLCGWHLYGHGFYDAEMATLESALAAVDTAIEKARGRQGAWLRQCVNDRARIAVGMKRWHLLEDTLHQILAITPLPRGVPVIRLENDFLRRVPEGAIDADLLRRYRAAFTARAAGSERSAS